MIDRIIVTSQKEEYNLVSADEVVVEWFSRPLETHTDIIINQINDGMYNRFFTGRKDLTIIDCGANIGLWTLYAQDSCKKIVSVEPAPHNLYILESFTKGMENVYIDACALSNSNGTIKMNVHTSPTCNSIVYDTDIDLAIDVKTKDLRTIMEDHDIEYCDFVKCDIEGAELLAITKDMLDAVKDKVGSWLIECHQTNREESIWPGNLEEHRQSIMALLNDAGYTTEALLHDQIYAWKE